MLLLTCLQDALRQPLCNGVQVAHDAGVAGPTQSQQLVVLPQHVAGPAAEVQGDGGLIWAQHSTETETKACGVLREAAAADSEWWR